MSITQQELKEILHYNPDTGVFTYKADSKLVTAGNEAGWLDNGYTRLKINGISYRCHRLAFIYMLGREPIGHVDHIDNLRCNNKWDNLREDAEKVNHWNRNLQANNTSGIKGVHWDKRKERYIAQIQVHGKKKQVGAYKTVEEATTAIQAYREQVHKEFANHG